MTRNDTTDALELAEILQFHQKLAHRPPGHPHAIVPGLHRPPAYDLDAFRNDLDRFAILPGDNHGGEYVLG